MPEASLSPARAFGLVCGDLPAGPLNTIGDVAGVTVGHKTLTAGDLRTGFTAIKPHQGNLFREKLVAAVDVINGFGKSAGLIQVEELGTLETPILLTNTFGVGTGLHALIKRAIAENPEIGRETGTVNPVVMECNDGHLSDIQALALTEADALFALQSTAPHFEQGSVGAGTGMSAFGFKGGIGSASRVFKLDERTFTLGALVLANFGNPGDLILPDGRKPHPKGSGSDPERGSVIIVLATDAPLESRQLKRVARRSGAGLARLGAYYGNGSGDIALAFSTAHKAAHFEERDFISREVLNEDRIDVLFKAAAETTQEAVLNSMISSPAMHGRGRSNRQSLADWLRGGR
ncbi:P1 family peptidase [Roseibium sp. RKSG952]|uniref:DmpA family aminopeptidase n=1 Tax=Roseibium sp. RKSG952 TaxID=2529384 RepID=UPI0012BBC1FE|nr:P1 family peptidase [Roseibium sp. RKSG952]MTH96929.1 S58 family peptidase [Roseibium sp. RKSG952]